MSSQLPCGLFTADTGTFCGPAALAAITGINAKLVENEVVDYRKVNGTYRKPRNARGCAVKTMWWKEIEPVAQRLGYRVAVDIRPRGNVSLKRWMEDHSTGNWFVLITGHFIAVNGTWMVDSLYRDGVTVPTKYLKRRVQCFALIEKVEAPAPEPMPTVQLDMFK